jgi:hypothetical protein
MDTRFSKKISAFRSYLSRCIQYSAHLMGSKMPDIGMNHFLMKPQATYTYYSFSSLSSTTWPLGLQLLVIFCTRWKRSIYLVGLKAPSILQAIKLPVITLTYTFCICSLRLSSYFSLRILSKRLELLNGPFKSLLELFSLT